MAPSPAWIASPSAHEMMPCAANIAAWAREPKTSMRAMRRSTPSETLIACIRSAGLAEKRPPHIDWPERWAEASSDMSGAEASDGRERWLGRALLVALGIGVAGVLYVTEPRPSNPTTVGPQPVAQRELERLATGSLARLEVPPSSGPRRRPPSRGRQARRCASPTMRATCSW
jgi:hypothetical protein